MKPDEQDTIDETDIEDTRPMRHLSHIVGRACDAWLAKRGMKPETWAEQRDRRKARDHEKARQQEAARSKPKPQEVRRCAECGNEFTVAMSAQKFCNAKCKMKDYRRTLREGATP